MREPCRLLTASSSSKKFPHVNVIFNVWFCPQMLYTNKKSFYFQHIQSAFSLSNATKGSSGCGLVVAAEDELDAVDSGCDSPAAESDGCGSACCGLADSTSYVPSCACGFSMGLRSTVDVYVTTPSLAAAILCLSPSCPARPKTPAITLVERRLPN